LNTDRIKTCAHGMNAIELGGWNLE
jgi:hypothetical protein